MNKKTKIVSIAIILMVIGIAITALFYVKIPDFLARGTVAKAEKYRQQTMTEQDIRFRSEFVRDTAQLRKVIASLTCFQQLNEKIISKIENGLNGITNHPLLTDIHYNQPLIELKEFGIFLDNHDSDLVDTRNMLLVFYKNSENADQSVDVEKNLRDFGGFIQFVIDKDSVFVNAAMDIDRYIDKESKKKYRVEDFKQLVNFRNDLLVSNIMMATMLGQKATIGKLSEYARSVNADVQVFSAVQSLNALYYNVPVQSVELCGFLNSLHDLKFVDVVE